MPADVTRATLLAQLTEYRQRHRDETPVVDRFVQLLATEPHCFRRDCWAGHITGSAWLVDTEGSHVLLTHHRKLGNWFQLGGHSDGDEDTLRVALREAQEESGLCVTPVSACIFDIDVHEIPARRQDPAHFHFDVRFAMHTASGRTFRVSAESHDLAWVDIARIREFTREHSMLRMAHKWQQGGA
jgi:8-oxo-dGTP pyrophosphatase MutT (NUDIX family)